VPNHATTHSRDVVPHLKNHMDKHQKLDSILLYLLNLEFDNILIGLFLLSIVLVIVLTEKKLTKL